MRNKQKVEGIRKEKNRNEKRARMASDSFLGKRGKAFITNKIAFPFPCFSYHTHKLTPLSPLSEKNVIIYIDRKEKTRNDKWLLLLFLLTLPVT